VGEADERGIGRSSKTGVGYNYDTFASDLDKLTFAKLRRISRC
jgi:hypothetical protein